MGVAYYNENDPFMADWLQELISRDLIAPGVVDSRSMLEVSPEDVKGFTQVHWFAGIGGWSRALRQAGWGDDVPVWTGSPPCQPFSTAGQQLGEEDERHLAPTFAKLVSQCQPTILFGEQVSNSKVLGAIARTPKQRAARDASTAWLDSLFDELERSYYSCAAADIPAASVGAPHIRQRTYFGAVRMADAERYQQWGRGRPGCKGQEGDEPGIESSGCSQAGGVAHSVGTGRGQAGCNTEGNREEDVGRSRDWNGNAGTDDERSRVENSPRSRADKVRWDKADWLRCRDGYYRPVEPGTFPLVNGLPGRVGRVRGYGNAIVPEVAATFITCFMEALDGYQ